MTIETDADRLIFLAADEFGSTATYTAVTGGASASVNGIFDDAAQAIDLGLGVQVASTGPQFIARTSDLTNGGRQGDTFVIGGTTYKAVDVSPDGTGMTTVKLEKQ
jgi:hypothetical protein